MIREPVALGQRPFDPGRDFPGAVNLIGLISDHDGDDWYPTPASLAVEWAPSPSFDPTRDATVVEVDGRLVAVGTVGWRERTGKVVHDIEVLVHPDARRQGLGRRLLAWLEDRARDSIAEGSGGPRELPHVLGSGVDQSHAASVAFAERLGYVPVRHGFQMRRPLDVPIPDVAMPDGFETRPVLPEQHQAIWAADSEAFKDHWEASVRQEADFRRMFAHPDVDTSLWQVAWAGGEVAGSVMNAIYREENAKTGLEIGWLDHVSVRRPWRGRGLASALIVRSLAILRDRGMAIAALGVDAENPTGALGVYERLGFRPHRTWKTYRKAI